MSSKWELMVDTVFLFSECILLLIHLLSFLCHYLLFNLNLFRLLLLLLKQLHNFLLLLLLLLLFCKGAALWLQGAHETACDVQSYGLPCWLVAQKKLCVAEWHHHGFEFFWITALHWAAAASQVATFCRQGSLSCMEDMATGTGWEAVEAVRVSCIDRGVHHGLTES